MGGCSKALSRVLPRKSGTGFLPSSQMCIQVLYFFIVLAGSVDGSHPEVVEPFSVDLRGFKIQGQGWYRQIH